MGLNKAKEVRDNLYLEKYCRYDGKVMTIRDWIKAIIEKGYNIPEIAEVPYYAQPTNTQWNRMYADEQEAFEKKNKRRKNEYRLYKGEDKKIFMEIKKTEYDYALSLLNKD